MTRRAANSQEYVYCGIYRVLIDNLVLTCCIFYLMIRLNSVTLAPVSSWISQRIRYAEMITTSPMIAYVKLFFAFSSCLASPPEKRTVKPEMIKMTRIAMPANIVIPVIVFLRRTIKEFILATPCIFGNFSAAYN